VTVPVNPGPTSLQHLVYSRAGQQQQFDRRSGVNAMLGLGFEFVKRYAELAPSPPRSTLEEKRADSEMAAPAPNTYLMAFAIVHACVSATVRGEVSTAEALLPGKAPVREFARVRDRSQLDCRNHSGKEKLSPSLPTDYSHAHDAIYPF
jgi:hypothetical protein